MPVFNFNEECMLLSFEHEGFDRIDIGAYIKKSQTKTIDEFCSWLIDNAWPFTTYNEWYYNRIFNKVKANYNLYFQMAKYQKKKELLYEHRKKK